jgi:cycloeucalenol cycloisomerase
MASSVAPMLVYAPNPDKAWAERFFLATSPLWIAAVATVVLSGVLRGWGDLGYLVFCTACAAPAMAGPLFVRSRPGHGAPLSSSHWFRFNLWVAIVVAFGTYFGTAYFFDLMGMRYAFPASWTLQSNVVGRTGSTVPVFMYPLTQAYFVTYFAVLTVADRTLRTKLNPGPIGRVLIVLGLAYAIAFAETFFMATDLMHDLFHYEQKDKMLAWGSFGYAAYFVVGLPMVRRLDEHGATWSLARVVGEALATCMAIMILLEVWAQAVGPL